MKVQAKVRLSNEFYDQVKNWVLRNPKGEIKNGKDVNQFSICKPDCGMSAAYIDTATGKKVNQLIHAPV